MLPLLSPHSLPARVEAGELPAAGGGRFVADILQLHSLLSALARYAATAQTDERFGAEEDERTDAALTLMVRACRRYHQHAAAAMPIALAPSPPLARTAP